MKTLRLYADAAARGNPGHAGIGVVIEDDHGARLLEGRKYIGELLTNNQAEYRALIDGLTAAHGLKPDRLEVYLDSEVVIEQMNGVYKVKKPELQLLYDQAKRLQDGLRQVIFRHVKRAQNRAADALANRAIDEHLGLAGLDPTAKEEEFGGGQSGRTK